MGAGAVRVVSAGAFVRAGTFFAAGAFLPARAFLPAGAFFAAGAFFVHGAILAVDAHAVRHAVRQKGTGQTVSRPACIMHA